MPSAPALSGLLAAGFADRFDRKRLLLFFYAGFMLGTLLCALAATYPMLLMARIVTGLFGGVIGSVVLAIATDLFPLEMRGRVMGFIQTAFAASQVLGLPAGLYFANRWDWHAPFWAIIAVAVPGGPGDPVVHEAGGRAPDAPPGTQPLGASGPHAQRAALPAGLHPDHAAAHRRLHADAVRHRLYRQQYRSCLRHPAHHLSDHRLFTVFVGPLVGKASDSFGKFNTFCFGSLLTIVMVAIWTNLGRTGLAAVIVINVLMFIGIFSRMIPSQALISAIPEVTKRGAFNAINASLQQFAGGVSAAVAGAVIVETPERTAGALQLAGLYRDGGGADVADADVFRAQAGARAAATVRLVSGGEPLLVGRHVGGHEGALRSSIRRNWERNSFSAWQLYGAGPGAHEPIGEFHVQVLIPDSRAQPFWPARLRRPPRRWCTRSVR